MRYFVILMLFSLILSCGEQSESKPAEKTINIPNSEDEQGNTIEQSDDIQNINTSAAENTEAVAAAFDLSDVLSKHFMAYNAEKLARVKTIYIKGSLLQKGKKSSIVSYSKRPNKSRFDLEVENFKLVQIFNGIKGWRIAQWENAKAMEATGDELERMREQADMDGLLYNWEQKGFSLSAAETVRNNGKKEYKIVLTKQDAKERTYYIDAESYLMTRMQTTIDADGKQYTVETVFDKYKTIDGIKRPVKMTSKTNGTTANVLTVDEIKFDILIDDMLFEKPPEK